LDRRLLDWLERLLIRGKDEGSDKGARQKTDRDVSFSTHGESHHQLEPGMAM